MPSNYVNEKSLIENNFAKCDFSKRNIKSIILKNHSLTKETIKAEIEFTKESHEMISFTLKIVDGFVETPEIAELDGEDNLLDNIGRLKHLDTFNMEGVRLEKIPKFHEQADLSCLILNDTHISELPPELFKFTGLLKLDFSNKRTNSYFHNCIEFIPESISKLYLLKELDLCGNPIKSFPETISSLDCDVRCDLDAPGIFKYGSYHFINDGQYVKVNNQLQELFFKTRNLSKENIFIKDKSFPLHDYINYCLENNTKPFDELCLQYVTGSTEASTKKVDLINQLISNYLKNQQSRSLIERITPLYKREIYSKLFNQQLTPNENMILEPLFDLVSKDYSIPANGYNILL